MSCCGGQAGARRYGKEREEEGREQGLCRSCVWSSRQKLVLPCEIAVA